MLSIISPAYIFFMLNKINFKNFSYIGVEPLPLSSRAPRDGIITSLSCTWEQVCPGRSVCPPRGLSLTLDRAQRSRGRRIILEMISQAASSAPGGIATSMPMLTLPGLSVTTTQSYNSVTVVDLLKVSSCVPLHIFKNKIK